MNLCGVETANEDRPAKIHPTWPQIVGGAGETIGAGMVRTAGEKGGEVSAGHA